MAKIVAIDDRDDPRIAAYRDIREQDLVGREGLFIAEGEVVVRVLLSGARHQAVSLLLAEKRVAALEAEIAGLADSVPVYVAPQAIMDDIAGLPMHRGILALGRRASNVSGDSLLARQGKRAIVVVLAGIANHDNMGGLFRNAAAFGADCVLLDSDCCDPLYRKAIRVSAGNVLSVPFARIDRGADLSGLLSSHGFESFALGSRGEKSLAELPRPERTAVFFGAEGPGLPEELLRSCTSVRIPMAAGVELAQCRDGKRHCASSFQSCALGAGCDEFVAGRGGDLEGVFARFMVIDLTGDHDLVGAGARDEALQAFLDHFRRSNEPACEHLVDQSHPAGIEGSFEIFDRRLQAAGTAAPQIDEGLKMRGEEALRFGLGIGGENIEAEHDMRLRQLVRRLEAGAIDGDRVFEIGGGEMRGEGIGQAEGSGELGAIEARTENPDRHVEAGAGNRPDPLVGFGVRGNSA